MAAVPLEIRVGDYSQRRMMRTPPQIMQDIVTIIYNLGGKAGRSQILSGARLAGGHSGIYIDKMVSEGYLERTPVKTKAGMRDGYHLTARGTKSFPEEPNSGQPRDELRDKDRWLVLADMTKNGTNKSRVTKVLGTSNNIIDKYLDFLLKYGLLVQSGQNFFSTPLYERVEKGALPYALDALFPHERKTPRLMELEMLMYLFQPVSSSRLKDSIPVTRYWALHNRILDRLLANNYAMKLTEGAKVKYQITEEGTGLLTRVDEAVRLLKASR